MTDKEKVKETLKEMYPQYSGFIEHTLVAEMCLKYHEKQCHIAPVVGRSKQFYCTCSRAKGLDHDEEGMPYCIECQKPVQ